MALEGWWRRREGCACAAGVRTRWEGAACAHGLAPARSLGKGWHRHSFAFRCRAQVWHVKNTSVRKRRVVVLRVPTSCSTPVGPSAMGLRATCSAWGSCWLCSSSHHRFKWPGQVSWQRCDRVSRTSPEHLKPSTILPVHWVWGRSPGLCVRGWPPRGSGGSPGTGRSHTGRESRRSQPFSGELPSRELWYLNTVSALFWKGVVFLTALLIRWELLHN